MLQPPTSQVLRKDDWTSQHFVQPVSPLPLLSGGSVRVRTSLLGITINNTSYAVMGSVLRWWDAFPVPSTFPAPYNDASTYGILCGWGHAIVLESSIPGIAPGSKIAGFLPLSSVAVDLQLAPASAAGHWIERSPHRENMMPFYQRYVVSSSTNTDPTELSQAEERAALEYVGGLREASYLLNRFSFASHGETPAHPLGTGLAWSVEDADLSGAAVVLLAASGKTALSMAYELQHRRGEGRQAKMVVGLTSEGNREFVERSGLYDVMMVYGDALKEKEGLEMRLKGVKKMVLIDYGARGTFTQDLYRRLKQKMPELTFQGIRVGGEHKTPAQKGESVESSVEGDTLDMVQNNTSPLRERAIEALGEQRYFEELRRAKKDFLNNGGMKGLNLTWSYGVEGDEGLEGVWKKYIKGSIPADEGDILKFVVDN